MPCEFLAQVISNEKPLSSELVLNFSPWPDEGSTALRRQTMGPLTGTTSKAA